MFIWITLVISIVFLSACQSSAVNTSDEELVSYNAYLFGCSFQHPRDWQVGPAFDWGGMVLMISDADPIEVFGFANRRGNEIAIGLFG